MHECVILIREERLLQTPDGALWSRWGTGRRTWIPYLRVFRRIILVARVLRVPKSAEGWTRADDPRVELYEVPYFHGPRSYANVLPALIRELRALANSGYPIILRVPSPLANTLYHSVRKRPYALEVAGDPYDQMAPGAMKHLLRPLFRRYYTEIQKRLCANAASLKYVTHGTLQRRYPPNGIADVFVASDVELTDTAFRPPPKAFSAAPIRLISVGMMEQGYKGHDTLIDAVAIAASRGHRIQLTIVGDGRHRKQLEDRTRATGIGSGVVFRGTCNRAAIQQALDTSDVFVLASRSEGLPRAMLEAMARSLPCIGTRVGGIPELLPERCLVRPNNPAALAAKLSQFIEHPSLLAIEGERNYHTAQLYRFDIRLDRESSFLHSVATRCSAAHEDRSSIGLPVR